MKMFFTYLIASFLFSLCLLEKEARKSAVPRNISDKNYAQSDRAGYKMTLIPDSQAQLHFQAENKLVVGQESNRINFSRFISTDSLSFSIGLAKQQNKVF